jgi:hypothetical protein
MTATSAADTLTRRRPGKLAQIARHRVLRWFRPPEAVVRRQRPVPHPFPRVDPTDATTAKETPRAQRD